MSHNHMIIFSVLWWTGGNTVFVYCKGREWCRWGDILKLLKKSKAEEAFETKFCGF